MRMGYLLRLECNLCKKWLCSCSYRLEFKDFTASRKQASRNGSHNGLMEEFLNASLKEFRAWICGSAVWSSYGVGCRAAIRIKSLMISWGEIEPDLAAMIAVMSTGIPAERRVAESCVSTHCKASCEVSILSAGRMA